LYEALYESVIASCRLGLNVVVDVGHHDHYSRPLGMLERVAQRLEDLPAYLIGVRRPASGARCPVPVIMARRDGGEPGREGRYVTSDAVGAVPQIVLRWERAVHDSGIYDLEVDTSSAPPGSCAVAIHRRLDEGPPRGSRSWPWVGDPGRGCPEHPGSVRATHVRPGRKRIDWSLT